jgi:hypothetical protein
LVPRIALRFALDERPAIWPLLEQPLEVGLRERPRGGACEKDRFSMSNCSESASRMRLSSWRRSIVWITVSSPSFWTSRWSSGRSSLSAKAQLL